MASVFLFGAGSKCFAQVDPFICDHKNFIVNGDSLYLYSSTGAPQVLFYVGNINALGYSHDNLLWAFDEGEQEIVRFDSNGVRTAFTVPNLPVGTADYNVGAIDTNGYFYLCYGEVANRFFTIDVDSTRTSTYGKLVNTTSGVIPYPEDIRTVKGTVMASNLNFKRLIADWVINPNNGFLYGVTTAGSFNPYRVVRMNPVNGNVFDVSTTAITGNQFQQNDAFGAIYIDDQSKFNVFGNTQGHLYQIDTLSNTALRLSTLSLANTNVDGANCISNIPLSRTASQVKVEQYGEGALITWSSKFGENMAFVELQRSADGKKWEKIQYFPVTEKKLTNDESMIEYVDQYPSKPKSWYRLARVSHDNRIGYSGVAILNFGDKLQSRIYPNPAQNKITLTGFGVGQELEFRNLVGTIAKSFTIDVDSQTVDISDLPSGVYLVKSKNGADCNSTHRLVISR